MEFSHGLLDFCTERGPGRLPDFRPVYEGLHHLPRSEHPHLWQGSGIMAWGSIAIAGLLVAAGIGVVTSWNRSGRSIAQSNSNTSVVCPRCSRQVWMSEIACTNCGGPVHRRIEQGVHEHRQGPTGGRVVRTPYATTRFECPRCFVTPSDIKCPHCQTSLMGLFRRHVGNVQKSCRTCENSKARGRRAR
jgi:DNA-directed RNA polymerase subunit RPC12/RpoP